MLSANLRKAKSGKKQSQLGAYQAKAEIRRRVLSAIPGARVLDVFAGSGGMYRAAWKDAESYVGIDRTWYRDGRQVYIGDNRIVLRSIPLEPFNVFDLDAYGSPWEQAWIIGRLRKWTPGEVVGLVLTYGTGFKLKSGGMSRTEVACPG